MEAVLTRTQQAQQARAKHRHDLRTLTYVILDEANGGVIRNLNHQGVAVQAVAAVRRCAWWRDPSSWRWPTTSAITARTTS